MMNAAEELPDTHDTNCGVVEETVFGFSDSNPQGVVVPIPRNPLEEILSASAREAEPVSLTLKTSAVGAFKTSVRRELIRAYTPSLAALSKSIPIPPFTIVEFFR